MRKERYQILKLSERKEESVLIAIFPFVILGLLKGFWVEELFRFSPPLFWFADTFQYLLLPTLGIIFLGKFAGIWPHDYGFRSLKSEYSVVDAVILFGFITFVFWVSYSPIKRLAYMFFWKSAALWSYNDASPTEQPLKMIVAGYLSLTAAFVEEAVFRALPWLYFNLRFSKKRYTGIYIIVTSTLFAAVHWQQGPHAVLAAFSVGIFSAYLYAKIRNIWPFVMAHFITDFNIFS